MPDIKLLPTILAEVSPYIFAPKPIWKCSNLEKFSAFSLLFQKLCFSLQRSTFVFSNAGRELAYSVQVIFMTSLKIFRCYRTPV